MSSAENYEKIREYISAHPIATIGTVDSKGDPRGAAVYICPDDQRHIIYFLTKNETDKYKNLIAHETVSVTVVNPAGNSTLQATGKAFTVRDAHALDLITKRMVDANPEVSEWIPPISRLEAGQYVVVGINLSHARLAEFQGMDMTQEHIFTEA